MTLKQLRNLAGMLISPGVDTRTQASRIDFMEVNVMLPVKLFIVGFLYYILYASGAFPAEMTVANPSAELAALAKKGLSESDQALSVTIATLRKLFWAYSAVTLTGAIFLSNMRRAPITVVQWTVFVINATDAIFLASLTVLTGVMREVTYWAFLFLIARNAVSVPGAWLQLPLNLMTISAYIVAGVYDKALVDVDYQRLDDKALAAGQDSTPGYYQTLTLRIGLLLLWTACCYGLQVLFDRQQEVTEEMREHVVRQEQLQTAGRLAAEIAHRIKNPLAIINNAVFSLSRHLKDGKGDAERQIQLIRDEVERSDRILTELMGYAQLAEGKIEKLDPADELELAIEQVFPPDARYTTQIQRIYDPAIPALQMQRPHLRDILMNLLLNAREAQNGGGRIEVALSSDSNYTVSIRITDDGPGIAPDKLERVFEPYFTTKDKGTGLGLAIVKHNAEIYGGRTAVESELGKGSTFVVQIPAKTMMRLRK
jgi:signal transduction histidine kinase